MTTAEIFMRWRKDVLIPAIVGNDDFKKAKASGNTQRFIESDASAEATDTRFIQYGPPYTYAIDKGRGPTSNKSGGLFDAIYEWVGLRKYGISFKDDKGRKSIAFAITKAISKHGSYKFKDGGVNSTKIFESAIRQSMPALYTAIVRERVKQIKSMFFES